MSEPWFDANLYAWIPGTSVGVIGGILGSMAGALAPRGRARSLVLGFHLVMIGVSAILLMAGAVAFVQGQPYGVWYGLGLPGVLGVIVLGALFPVVSKRYREAEARRLAAQDL
jgi:hypothetical protein